MRRLLNGNGAMVGGGIMGLFLSSLLYIIEFIIGIVFGARILLSFIWDHDTLYTHGTVQYLSALDYQAQRLHAVTNNGRGR